MGNQTLLTRGSDPPVHGSRCSRSLLASAWRTFGSASRISASNLKAASRGEVKPDPGIFRVALERLACHAEEAVMIGDSWRSDVLGARSAGIRAIWFNRTGLPCPDPTLATEIRALEPLNEVVRMILQEEKRNHT